MSHSTGWRSRAGGPRLPHPSPHRRQRLGQGPGGAWARLHAVPGSHKDPLWPASQTGSVSVVCYARTEKLHEQDKGEWPLCPLCRLGPGAAAGRGNGEGHQWEGERAGRLFLEGSQSAEAEESQERSAPHGGSNLQLGSRLQLAGMRPAGAWDLLSPAEMVQSGGQGLIPMPCVQIPAAGAEAFPAGHSSLSFSMRRF